MTRALEGMREGGVRGTGRERRVRRKRGTKGKRNEGIWERGAS